VYWNASGNDRVFLQVQNDHGYLPFYVDPISPLIDADGYFPWWQGQLIETHTFGSSAASQVLLAGSYCAATNALVHGSQALDAFPATHQRILEEIREPLPYGCDLSQLL
jgi:hypothetical protein